MAEASPRRFRFESYQPGRERWETYAIRLGIALAAQGFVTEADKKLALLQVSNSEVFEALIDQLYPSELSDAAVTHESIIAALKTRYGERKVSKVAAEAVFLNRAQKSGETVAEYLADLRRLAAECGFSNAMLNGRLKSQLVRGCSDAHARAKLLRKSDDYTLDQVVATLERYERVHQSPCQPQAAAAVSESPWVMVNSAHPYNVYVPMAGPPQAVPGASAAVPVHLNFTPGALQSGQVHQAQAGHVQHLRTATPRMVQWGAAAARQDPDRRQEANANDVAQVNFASADGDFDFDLLF